VWALCEEDYKCFPSAEMAAQSIQRLQVEWLWKILNLLKQLTNKKKYHNFI